MNILIVYCHPSKNSYTNHILEQLKKRLYKKRWPVEISDLYGTRFKSDMTDKEFDREAFSKNELPVPADVRREHKKLSRADCVIFLYPLWWSGCPAKLKGWFDRVFTVGFAYKQTNESPGMKKMKYGLALCTAGYTDQFLKEVGIAQSMKTIMLDDRLGERFENRELIILGGTLDLEKVKHDHLLQIRELVNKMEQFCG